jgi:hypothetical protein
MHILKLILIDIAVFGRVALDAPHRFRLGHERIIRRVRTGVNHSAAPAIIASDGGRRARSEEQFQIGIARPSPVPLRDQPIRRTALRFQSLTPIAPEESAAKSC